MISTTGNIALRHAACSADGMQNALRLVQMPTDDTIDRDQRDTEPPSAFSEPPPDFNPLPSEALQRMAGYDPDLFLHAALMAAADGAHEQRQANRTSADIVILLERQTDIVKETRTDIGLVRSSLTGLQQSVDALVTRVGNTERAVEAGTERFTAIELDMAVMRTQLDRLDRELAVIKASQHAKPQ